MPWNNQDGGGRGPWGQGQGNGGQPPDLEELLKRGQDRFKRAFPGGRGGGGMGAGGLIVILLALGVAWYGFTGVHRVLPTETGVVTFFGKYTTTLPDGLHFRWPWPIEAVRKVQMTTQEEQVGFATNRSQTRNNPLRDESLMLTGDENIVDIDFKIIWQVSNPRDFLFNVENPEDTVKAVAESAMREVIGRSKLQPILTQRRGGIQQDVQKLMQETLNGYTAGIQVNQVQLERADPPSEVIDAFRDVQAANQDKERLSNEAQGYANKVIPEARGEAERIRQAAEAYKQETIAEAQGQAARFISVMKEYSGAKDVTRQRIFLETMENVFRDMNKVIIDEDAGGVVPYLPLTEIGPGNKRQRRPAATPAPARSGNETKGGN